MYLLDTNIISFIARSHTLTINKLASVDADQVSTCSIVMSELFFGAINHPDPDRGKIHLQNYSKLSSQTLIYDFDIEAAMTFAQLKSQLKKTGIVIDDFDLLIASIALANNLILVTNNIKHFAKIPNLQLEDWSK